MKNANRRHWKKIGRKINKRYKEKLKIIGSSFVIAWRLHYHKSETNIISDDNNIEDEQNIIDSDLMISRGEIHLNQKMMTMTIRNKFHKKIN